MGLALCYIISITLAGYLLWDSRRFNARRDSIEYRIHVNGIRGKSSVTRYVTAVLRDSGLTTYGKTTGTAARVILPDGQDQAILRRGLANVNEQVQIMRSFADRNAQAVVMECMAINPDYQEWLETKVMHSHITIITNVRLDHQEEMGRTLADIARSMSRSIPRNAYLITSERRPEVLEIFAAECSLKDSQLIQAPSKSVTDADLATFSHVAHRDNVAIGLAVAQLFNVAPAKALRAMATAGPDPGIFRLQSMSVAGKEVIWANLFAVNDKESFAEIAATLASRFAGHYRIVMLNNRFDRPSRVEMFTKLAQNEYQANAIVALGDYEDRVKDSVSRRGIRVAPMGNNSTMANSSGAELLEKIVGLADQPKILLVGTVNVHTAQSERIQEEISRLTGDTTSTADVPYYQPRLRPEKKEAEVSFGH
jgi:poly-gamma-glutamate synthase PgsB/CapB